MTGRIHPAGKPAGHGAAPGAPGQNGRAAPDSGGPGRHRGGLANRRLLEVTAPEITISAMIDRMEVAPFGLFGGKDGASTGLYIKRANDEEFRTFTDVFGTVSPNKFSGLRVHAGDQIMIQSSGGGGFGDSSQRNPEAVLEDLREGYVSLENARTEYGVEIVERDGEMALAGNETKDSSGLGAIAPDPLTIWPDFAHVHSDGQFVQRFAALYETEGITCELCGKIMPSQYWPVQQDGREMKFCNAECHTVYVQYWKPRYLDA